MAKDWIGVEMTGLPELDKVLTELGRAGSKAALTAALRVAVVPVRDEAVRLAPRSTDRVRGKPLASTILIRSTLSKSQRSKRRRRGEKESFARVFVGASAPHAHLLEFGHMVKSRGPKRKGQPPKSGLTHVAARPFMRPAFEIHKVAVRKTLAKEVWVQVVRVARRFRKQAERGKLSKGARVALKVPL